MSFSIVIFIYFSFNTNRQLSIFFYSFYSFFFFFFFCVSKKVDRENNHRLELLPSSKVLLAAKDWGRTEKHLEKLEKDCMWPSRLTIKQGAQVGFWRFFPSEITRIMRTTEG
jgi:hypothetical protein